jgi:hypothetical protein
MTVKYIYNKGRAGRTLSTRLSPHSKKNVILSESAGWRRSEESPWKIPGESFFTSLSCHSETKNQAENEFYESNLNFFFPQ